jgi:O6-methylguanine-DNA--protein-cysteine methyltransferase
MRTRKREIARAGIYGATDNPKTVSTKDIKEIEETFSDIRRAPIQFGHGTNAAAPRLGNVVSVYSDHDGNSLYADIEENDALAAAVDSGYYPDVSIGAKQRARDGKMYLHHLAYLGQEAPAIKDLIAEIQEPLGIAADDADGLVFFPPLCDFQMNLSEPVKPKKEETLLTNEEAQKLREENERLKGELEKRNVELSDSVKQKTAADAGRLKSALNAAKIPAVQQERLLQIAAAIEPGKTIELSDGAGGTEKTSAVDALIRAVSAIPVPVQTGMLDLSDFDDQNNGKRDYSSLRSKG